MVILINHTFPSDNLCGTNKMISMISEMISISKIHLWNDVCIYDNSIHIVRKIECTCIFVINLIYEQMKNYEILIMQKEHLNQRAFRVVRIFFSL